MCVCVCVCVCVCSQVCLDASFRFLPKRFTIVVEDVRQLTFMMILFCVVSKLNKGKKEERKLSVCLFCLFGVQTCLWFSPLADSSFYTRVDSFFSLSLFPSARASSASSKAAPRRQPLSRLRQRTRGARSRTRPASPPLLLAARNLDESGTPTGGTGARVRLHVRKRVNLSCQKHNQLPHL